MASYKVISSTELIRLFQQALDEKWGYIINTSGQTWTAKDQEKATDEMTLKYGKKWIGKRVSDCSGLFSWAFKKLDSYMPHGSNSMWNSYCVHKGKLVNGKRSDGQPLKPGTAVFKLRDGTDRHHVGLWDGTKVIEAKGTAYGVVANSKLSSWDEWGELKYVKYTNFEVNDMPNDTITYPTLRKGDKGDTVTMMQDLLSKNGSSLQVDGIFGSGTLNALKTFQKKKGLEVDGVCGPKTWAALLATVGLDETDDKVETPSVQYTDSEKLAILWDWYQSTLRTKS